MGTRLQLRSSVRHRRQPTPCDSGAFVSLPSPDLKFIPIIHLGAFAKSPASRGGSRPPGAVVSELRKGCAGIAPRTSQTRQLSPANRHRARSTCLRFARTDGATEILLEDVLAGDKLKVRGVNDTNEGPFSPEVTVA